MTELYLHINVVDQRSPRIDRALTRREARIRGQTVNIRVDQAWSMDRICRRVLQNSPAGLGVLRIFCHGNSGSVELGQGLNMASVPSFRLLRGHFVGQFPKIEVHSCGVLSGTPVSRQQPIGMIDLNAHGHVLMQALANAAQVLVIAAYNVQDCDRRMAFEGPIRHFRPQAGL